MFQLFYFSVLSQDFVKFEMFTSVSSQSLSWCFQTKFKLNCYALLTWVWAPGATCCTWTPSSPRWCSWCRHPCPCLWSRRRRCAEPSGFSDPGEPQTSAEQKGLRGMKKSNQVETLHYPHAAVILQTRQTHALTTDGAQRTFIGITKSSVGTFKV